MYSRGTPGHAVGPAVHATPRRIGGDLAAHIRAGVHRVQGAIPLTAQSHLPCNPTYCAFPSKTHAARCVVVRRSPRAHAKRECALLSGGQSTRLQAGMSEAGLLGDGRVARRVDARGDRAAAARLLQAQAHAHRPGPCELPIVPWQYPVSTPGVALRGPCEYRSARPPSRCPVSTPSVPHEYSPDVFL